MNQIDISSLLIGALVTLVFGLISYALSRYILFKTRILWSDDYYNCHTVTLDRKEHGSNNFVVINSYLVAIKGWEAAKSVNVHLTGNFTLFEVKKIQLFGRDAVPYVHDKETNIVRIGRLENKKIYRIVIKLEGGSHEFIPSIKNIEAENVTVEKGIFAEPQLSDFWKNGAKTILAIWGFFWMIEKLIEIIEALSKGVAK